MRCVIRWRQSNGRPRQSDRFSRLNRLLDQAHAAGYYRRIQSALPEAAPYASEYLEPWLSSIPKVSLSEFLRNPVEFHNWHGPPRRLQALECPIGTIGRTAVLAEGFEETDTTRTFNYFNAGELEEFEPDSLAGPVYRLKTLAEAALQGRFALDSLRSVVIAFTGLKHGCMGPADRDLLWRAFQVPVFEQFRGFSQELLAYECEAHDGLHIHSENAIFETPRNGELLLTSIGCEEYTVLRLGTEMTARLATYPCGCGDAGPRLIGLRAVSSRGVALAAHA